MKSKKNTQASGVGEASRTAGARSGGCLHLTLGREEKAEESVDREAGGKVEE